MKKGIAILLVLFWVVACQKFIPPDITTNISTHGDDESHYKGDNCMNCHYTAGNAQGAFTLAGSAFGNTGEANFELYTDMNAPPVHMVEVDLLGNAYTTEPIDFTAGWYVGVRNANGDVEFMEDKIFNGQCNLCHGTSIEERIEIE